MHLSPLLIEGKVKRERERVVNRVTDRGKLRKGMRVANKKYNKELESTKSTSDEVDLPYEEIQRRDVKKLFSDRNYTLR